MFFDARCHKQVSADVNELCSCRRAQTAHCNFELTDTQDIYERDFKLRFYIQAEVEKGWCAGKVFKELKAFAKIFLELFWTCLTDHENELFADF